MYPYEPKIKVKLHNDLVKEDHNFLMIIRITYQSHYDNKNNVFFVFIKHYFSLS